MNKLYNVLDNSGVCIATSNSEHASEELTNIYNLTKSPLIKIERRFVRDKTVPCQGYHKYRVTVYDYTTEWMVGKEWKEWKQHNLVEVDV